MKYDPEKSFGYPVLSNTTDDYLKSNFQTEIDFNINEDNPKQFKIEYMFACGVKELKDLVAQGNAAYWVKVACRSTFYSKMFEVKAMGEFLLDGNDLRDTVEFSGFIIGKRDCTLASGKINPEFGYQEFQVSNGQVLALGEPRVYVTDKEFWKPISSIFEVRPKEELKDGEYTVDLDAESGFVTIFASLKQCQILRDFERTKEGKIILLNTVYFIAVSKMIEALRERPADYSETKWARVLKAKAASKNIDINHRDELLPAHKILGHPLTALTPALLDK